MRCIALVDRFYAEKAGGGGGKAIAMGEVMGIIEKVWATSAANHSFAQGKRQQQVLKLLLVWH